MFAAQHDDLSLVTDLHMVERSELPHAVSLTSRIALWTMQKCTHMHTIKKCIFLLKKDENICEITRWVFYLSFKNVWVSAVWRTLLEQDGRWSFMES